MSPICVLGSKRYEPSASYFHTDGGKWPYTTYNEKVYDSDTTYYLDDHNGGSYSYYYVKYLVAAWYTTDRPHEFYSSQITAYHGAIYISDATFVGMGWGRTTLTIKKTKNSQEAKDAEYYGKPQIIIENSSVQAVASIIMNTYGEGSTCTLRNLTLEAGANMTAYAQNYYSAADRNAEEQAYHEQYGNQYGTYGILNIEGFTYNPGSDYVGDARYFPSFSSDGEIYISATDDYLYDCRDTACFQAQHTITIGENPGLNQDIHELNGFQTLKLQIAATDEYGEVISDDNTWNVNNLAIINADVIIDATEGNVQAGILRGKGSSSIQAKKLLLTSFDGGKFTAESSGRLTVAGDIDATGDVVMESSQDSVCLNGNIGLSGEHTSLSVQALKGITGASSITCSAPVINIHSSDDIDMQGDFYASDSIKLSACNSLTVGNLGSDEVFIGKAALESETKGVTAQSIYSDSLTIKATDELLGTITLTSVNVSGAYQGEALSLTAQNDIRVAGNITSTSTNGAATITSAGRDISIGGQLDIADSATIYAANNITIGGNVFGTVAATAGSGKIELTGTIGTSSKGAGNVSLTAESGSVSFGSFNGKSLLVQSGADAGITGGTITATGDCSGVSLKLSAKKIHLSGSISSTSECGRISLIGSAGDLTIDGSVVVAATDKTSELRSVAGNLTIGENLDITDHADLQASGDITVNGSVYGNINAVSTEGNISMATDGYLGTLFAPAGNISLQAETGSVTIGSFDGKALTVTAGGDEGITSGSIYASGAVNDTAVNLSAKAITVNGAISSSLQTGDVKLVSSAGAVTVLGLSGTAAKNDKAIDTAGTTILHGATGVVIDGSIYASAVELRASSGDIKVTGNIGSDIDAAGKVAITNEGTGSITLGNFCGDTLYITATGEVSLNRFFSVGADSDNFTAQITGASLTVGGEVVRETGTYATFKATTTSGDMSFAERVRPYYLILNSSGDITFAKELRPASRSILTAAGTITAMGQTTLNAGTELHADSMTFAKELTASGTKLCAADGSSATYISLGSDIILGSGSYAGQTLGSELIGTISANNHDVTLENSILRGTISGANTVVLKGSTIDNSVIRATSVTINSELVAGGVTISGKESTDMTTFTLNGNLTLQSATKDNSIKKSEVGGTIEANGYAVVLNNSTIDGDINRFSSLSVSSGSEITGDVYALEEGTVTVSESTISGCVYDAASLSLLNSSIGGMDNVGALVTSGSARITTDYINADKVFLNGGSLTLNAGYSHEIATLIVNTQVTITATTTINSNLELDDNVHLTLSKGTSLELGCSLTLNGNASFTIHEQITPLNYVTLMTGVDELHTSGGWLTDPNHDNITYTLLTETDHGDGTYTYTTGATEGNLMLVYNSDTGSFALTPEPATATLSLLALAGLAARRRLR